MTKRFALLFFSLLLYVTFIPGSTAAEVLKLSDLFNFEYATDPQISPDGKTIVYVRNFCDIMTDKRYSNLWLVSADGKDHRPVTTGQFNDNSPRWSADGKNLIFLSNRDGKPQVYHLWLQSGQMARLTNIQEPPNNISWSPDGRWISFTS